MELILYTNSSDDHTVTKNLTQILDITNGVLREECSIIDPVIKIEGLQAGNYANCNYAYIPSFGRYYFVKNIILKGNLCELHMHVDVLSSFATELKALDAIVSRQEKKYNLYLQDGLFRTYQNPHIQIKQFPVSFDTFEFIFSVAG